MDENSAKKFKSSSLEEVLEIFTSFSSVPVKTNFTAVVKKEINASPVKFGDRYAHIMVKETLVDEDELLEKDQNHGVAALVGNNFIQRDTFSRDVVATDSRKGVLDELEILRKCIQVKFLQKAADYRELQILYEKTNEKNHDEELENEVKKVLKIKQNKINDLEEELTAFKNSNVDTDMTRMSNQNSLLKEELEKKGKEVKAMELRINHVKELVTVSAEKIRTVKQKEDHFKRVEQENVRLDILVTKLTNANSDTSEMDRKVEALAAEIKIKDDKLYILKETNINLEKELNLSMDSPRKNEVRLETGLKVRDEEITTLREKIRSLTSDKYSLQLSKADVRKLEIQLCEKETQIRGLKEGKEMKENQLINKYESILVEKDKELFSLKGHKFDNSNTDDTKMKAEFKTYFDELERKSQQFLYLIKEQQSQINTLKVQAKAQFRIAPDPARRIQPPQADSNHYMPRGQLKPIPSQSSNPVKERLEHLSNLTINVQPSLPTSTNSPLPDLVSFSPSNAGVSQYDLAPSYYTDSASSATRNLPAQLPLADYKTSRSFSSDSTQNTSAMLEADRLSVLGKSMLESSCTLDMPVLSGSFSFD